jgi:hypothetical protein
MKAGGLTCPFLMLLMRTTTTTTTTSTSSSSSSSRSGCQEEEVALDDAARWGANRSAPAALGLCLKTRQQP